MTTARRLLPRPLVRLALLTLVLGLGLATPAGAATVTFDGGAGGFGTDWNTAANWSPDSVPTASDDVVVPAGFTAIVGAGAPGVGDTLDLDGTLRVDNTLTIGTAGDPTPGTSSLGGTSTNQVHGSGLLRLNGITNWSSGSWFLGDFAESAGVVENAGTLNVTGNATMNDGGGTVGLVRNLSGATINRTTSAGTATIGAPLDNDGSVNVSTGTLAFSAGSASGAQVSAGSFAVSSGAVLRFANATFNLDGSPASIGGADTVTLDGGAVVSLAAGDTYNPTGTTLFSGGRLTLASAGSTSSFATDGDGGIRDGAGTLAVGTGSSNLNNILFDGGTTTFPAGATLPATGIVQVAGSTTLRLNGTTNWSSGSWFLGDSAEPAGVVENAGTFNVPGDTSMTDGGGAFGLFRNLAAGTIDRTTSAGTASMSVPLENAGLVDVETGTLLSDDAATQTAGTTRVAAGATFDFASLALQGGILTGSGTVDGPVTNTSGTVRPGTSPGTLTITGNYTQGSGGTLETEIAGTTPGTQFDRLVVGGAATLDGTLAIASGFTPALTDTFKIVTSASRSGQFSSVTGAQPGNGRTYTPRYDADGVTLLMSSGPSPQPPPGPTPPPPPPAPKAEQCGDGIDNDGDGAIDAADPGCLRTKGDESDETVGDLVLCGRSSIRLVRADLRGRTVVLSGLVATRFAGSPVTLTQALRGKRRELKVVTAKADGSFTARVARPRRSQLAKVRYQAQVASFRSARLKLPQSVESTSIRRSGGEIVIRGKVKRSVLGARKPVVIRRLLCGRTTTAGSARPNRRGVYVIRFKAPAEGDAALYRAESRVLARPGGRRYVKQFARAVALRLTAASG